MRQIKFCHKEQELLGFEQSAKPDPAFFVEQAFLDKHVLTRENWDNVLKKNAFGEKRTFENSLRIFPFPALLSHVWQQLKSIFVCMFAYLIS